MTVQELIGALEEFDPEAAVVLVYNGVFKGEVACILDSASHVCANGSAAQICSQEWVEGLAAAAPAPMPTQATARILRLVPAEE